MSATEIAHAAATAVVAFCGAILLFGVSFIKEVESERFVFICLSCLSLLVSMGAVMAFIKEYKKQNQEKFAIEMDLEDDEGDDDDFQMTDAEEEPFDL